MKDKKRKRITITCYDDEGYDLVTHYPLCEIIETTKETGLCFCTFSDNRRVYVEKTKAGYTIKAWREERE